MLFRLFCILVLSFSLAQGFPALDGVVATDSSLLDIPAINQAAAKLEAKNIKPLVLFIEGDTGSSLDEDSAYFDRALESYGLLSSGVAPSNLFALFVGTNPLPESGNQRPIYIAYGQDLIPTLQSLAGNKNVDEFIRNDLMIPKLLEGNFTQAFTSAMLSVAERLPNITNPQITNESTWLRLLKSYGWLALPVLGLLGVVGLRRRSKKSPVISEPKEDLDVVRKDIQKTLEELKGSLPSDPLQQTEMLLLANFMQEEHPDEWQALNQDYTEAVKTYLDANQKMQLYALQQPAPEVYQTLKEELDKIKLFVAQLNDKWLILNREVMAVPDRIKALKGSIQQLRVGYKERSDFLTADEVFKPLEEDIIELEGLHQASQSLKSLKLLNQTQTNMSLVQETITRLMEADQRLDDYENLLPSFQQQGFNLFRYSERIQDTRAQFAIALGLIKQGEYKVVDAQVDEVEELVSDVVDGSKQVMDLYKTNQQKLAELLAEGERIKTLIETTSQTFDKVNDFAPSTWRDIEGHGSEAEALTHLAFDLYQQALEANTLEGAQEFEAARAMIDQGFENLVKAKELLQAIEDRLQRLTQAQQTAKTQLAVVEQDLQQHWDFLHQPDIDKDVGLQPEQTLNETRTLVDKIKLELSQLQPNWLEVMQSIQAADHLTDKALETMRSEQEAMEHRRLRVTSEKVEATTALERLKNYLQIHASKLSQSSLSDAQTLFSNAERLEQQALHQSEALLAQTLEQADPTL